MKENWQNTTFNRKEYVMSQPKIKKLTQREMVLQHLKEGRVITPLEALQKYGSLRLGAIIHTLRREGMNIETNYITVERKTFAEYKLITEQQQSFLEGEKNDG